jgi:hypothetical protein
LARKLLEEGSGESLAREALALVRVSPGDKVVEWKVARKAEQKAERKTVSGQH